MRSIDPCVKETGQLLPIEWFLAYLISGPLFGKCLVISLRDPEIKISFIFEVCNKLGFNYRNAPILKIGLNKLQQNVFHLNASLYSLQIIILKVLKNPSPENVKNPRWLPI